MTVDPTIPAPVVLPIPVTGAGSTDADVLARLLAEEQDIETSLADVERSHVLDISGPAMLAIDRARGTAEQLAIELRIAFRYLGGGA
jgi:hypothetical protein